MGILDKFRLDGKVAIVTGASRGLGEAMAVALAEAGADVAVVARGKEALEKVAERIKSIGRDCLPLAFDIAQRGAPQKVVDAVLRWKGTVDILCNNAGTIVRGLAEEVTEEGWDTVMRLNLDAAFFMAQAAGRVMIQKRRGKIINTGSMNSIVSARNIIPYTVSKGGILQMTKALAVEWASYNVQVNCILPGYYHTEMTKPLQGDKERYQWFLNRIPAGRWGEPEDLQGAVVFLASSASDYVTGIALPVDGGYLAG